MKSLVKRLGILLVLVLAVVSFGQAVLAQDYELQAIKVDGLVMVEGQSMPVYVERGSKVSVEIFFNGASDGTVAYDTKVKAWIGGYEYGDIESTTEIFQVLPGVQYKKVLILDIPEDLESSEEYTLNIDIYDDDQILHREFTLVVEETRHLVNIYDATFNPSKVVKAGQPLFVSARLENLGDNAEDNIKVMVKIAGLGVQAEEYVDELTTWNAETEDEDDAASSTDFTLMIPSDAKASEYTLDIIVEYNRGHNIAKKSFKINVVEGTKATLSEDNEVNALVSAVTTSQAVQAGEGAVYKLNVANMGDAASVYTFNVKGTEGWGTYSVDPSALTIAGDSTGEANVYVSPSESTTTGMKTFTVDVLSNGAVVGSATFNLDVANENGSSTKEVLLIVFLVLLAILVLLGIALVIKKLAGSKESENVEGQTYY